MNKQKTFLKKSLCFYLKLINICVLGVSLHFIHVINTFHFCRKSSTVCTSIFILMINFNRNQLPGNSNCFDCPFTLFQCEWSKIFESDFLASHFALKRTWFSAISSKIDFTTTCIYKNTIK